MISNGKRILALSILFLLQSVCLHAVLPMPTIYYVDQTYGNDAWPGTLALPTPTANPANGPWRTIAKVNASTFVAGDAILFKRGEIWREQLTVPSSGSTGTPITFGAYGTGTDKPLITGADLLTRWSAESFGSITLYKTTIATRPTQVFENSVRKLQVSAKSLLVPGSWFWDAPNSQVYIRTSHDDPAFSYTIEASVRFRCIEISQSNIVIQDLELTKSSESGTLGSKNNITIQRCTVRQAFLNNIGFGAPFGTYMNPAVYDCDISEAGANGVILAYNLSGGRIQRNVIHENSRLHNALVGGDPQQQYSAGVKIWCANAPDSGADTIVSENKVWGNAPHPWVTSDGHDDLRGVGIWLDELKIPSLQPTLVKSNIVHDNASWGVYLEKTQRCGAEINLIYNNAAAQYTANLALHTNSGVGSSDSWAYNNTVYGTGWAAVIFGGSDSLINCRLINNILAPTTGKTIYFMGMGADATKANIIDFNCYATSAPLSIDTTAATLARQFSTIATWRAASGQDTHSLNADPQFVSIVTPDFRLRPTSPAINAALPVGLMRDLVGVPVPQGTAPDIGAYESGSPLSPTNLKIKINSR